MTSPSDVEGLARAFLLLVGDVKFGGGLGEKLKKKFEDRCWDVVARRHFEL